MAEDLGDGEMAEGNTEVGNPAAAVDVALRSYGGGLRSRGGELRSHPLRILGNFRLALGIRGRRL